MQVEMEWKLKAAACCRVLGMLQGPALAFAGLFEVCPGRFVLYAASFGCAKLCGAQNRLTRE